MPTDFSTNNIPQGISDIQALSDMEDDEMNHPLDRKVLEDRIIYLSRPMPMNVGLPVLCDFGEARIGRKHSGDAMPGITGHQRSSWIWNGTTK